jgi:hypothetical protein
MQPNGIPQPLAELPKFHEKIRQAAQAAQRNWQ